MNNKFRKIITFIVLSQIYDYIDNHIPSQRKNEADFTITKLRL